MKTIIRFLIFYFIAGLFYNMIGEYRLAQKYVRAEHRQVTPARILSRIFFDPNVILRAIVFSPFWTVDIYWDVYYLTR